MFGKRVSNNKGEQRSYSSHICWNCFNTQQTSAAHLAHVAFCHTNKCQLVRMPEEGSVRQFEQGNKSCSKVFNSAFMLFFDFEALQTSPSKPCSCSEEVLENTRREKSEVCRQEDALEELMLEGEVMLDWQNSVSEAREAGRRAKRQPDKLLARPRRRTCPHKTAVVSEQPPFAFAYVLVDRDGKVRERDTYVGKDAAVQFIKTVVDVADRYLPTLSPGEPLTLTAREKRKLRERSDCYLCGEHMEEDERVIDHDHLNGKFLGVAHSKCNLQRVEQSRLTCFAHNFSGYDSHFLVKALGEEKLKKVVWRVEAIPQNTQRFKTITLNRKIKFVDSLQFLQGSLAGLVETLVASGSSFRILDELVPFSGTWHQQLKDLLLRKGVYPYSFATSIEKMANQRELPPRACFTSELTGEECGEEDYEHAQKVWEEFDCRDMLDYTKLYVETDVFLLAEVVMDLRDNIWRSFKLDLCQYISLPQLAFDIMLKETGAEIEHIHEQEMADLLRKNIRGGLSYVSTRHFELDEGRDERVLYVDANNLYGKAMTFPLPTSDLRWMTKKEVEKFDISSIHAEDGDGYILEVDLDYPEHLHLAHNAMPLAPESVSLDKDEDLSDYSKDCLAVLSNKRAQKVTKLTATFKPR